MISSGGFLVKSAGGVLKDELSDNTRADMRWGDLPEFLGQI